MAGQSQGIATTPTNGVEEDPLLLYEPITQQINAKKIPWTESYELVTPQQARTWLREADEYRKLGQRKRTKARVTRWLTLYQTGRYAFYNPLAALCFNTDGIIMNGGNRMAALAEHDGPVGFKIVRNCPTWMVQYFDNGNNRSIRDSMYINMRDTRPAAQALVRLGMRYEEFLFGKRGQYGWANWSKVKDEYADIDNFYGKRDYVMDFVDQGIAMHKKTNLQPASCAAFIAYQQLAWPAGQNKLDAFLDGLNLGVMLDKGNPALTLREWGNRDGYIGGYTHGRREGHLLLLMKYFMMFVENVNSSKVEVAKGLPMQMPYHPKGWDVASENVREALLEMG